MDGAKFTMDLSSSGAAKLRECVKEKLSEYIGNYTDDVLVEYVVVLIGHGKDKTQAVKDLEAFLGGDSDSFVTWLWDHIASNKLLYSKNEDDEPVEAGLVDENPQAQQSERSLRSVVAVVGREEPTTQMESEEQPEGRETVGAVNTDDASNGEEVARRRAHRRDGLHRNNTKRSRSRSPEIWTRRGRGRADRPDVKEMSPPVVKASRRLLINAVREAVNENALFALNKDSLKRTESVKRIQSVVSSADDLQGNGRADVDMTRGDPVIAVESVDVVDVHVNSTVKILERPVQGKPASVWDRINVSERNRQNALVAEDEFAEGGALVENMGMWNRNGAASHRLGPEKGRGARALKFNGVQQPGRKLRVNGQLLGDALRRVKPGQMPNQDSGFRRNGLHSKTPAVQRLGNDYSQIHGEAGDDDLLVDEDVLEMKKRLRQVQLDMTKLRARQAEVTWEVQNAPAVGARPIPFDPQPTQEDINSRSVFVTNVHFAATQAALRVHFGWCGNINRVTMLVEPATGKPKGSAYVEFSSLEAAESALTLNDTALLSRNLKVIRKNSAVVEMNSIPVPVKSYPQFPFSRGFPTPHSLYTARRPMGLSTTHVGTSNLKWKRDASAGAGTPTTVTPPADVEMIHTGPVRFSRSLSYVRVAPYPTAGSTGETQKI